MVWRCDTGPVDSSSNNTLGEKVIGLLASLKLYQEESVLYPGGSTPARQ